ncbi:MAG TPA: hypothetical protein VI299_09215 [Polyangiales bacterium]
MTAPCQAWASLSDRESLGEALREDERAFLVQHAASCSACAAENAVWDDLRGLMEPAPKVKREPRRWPVFVLAAASVLLSFISDRAGEREPQERARLVAAEVLTKATVSQARSLEVDGELAQVGDDVPVGAALFARGGVACLHVEPGVRVCAREGSSFRMASLGNERRIELRSGKLEAELDPQPAGTSFGVLTRDGVSIAVGTAFSVELPPNGPAITRVIHGTVLVRNRSGAEQRVTAHQMTRVDVPTEVRPLEEESPGVRLVESEPPSVIAEPVRASARAVGLEPVKVPEPSTVSLESVKAPPAPVAEQPGPVAEQPGPVAAQPGPAAEPRVRESFENEKEPTAFELLTKAREERARGDVEAALASYRTLLARHAESAEAQAARVPYGEMLLSRRDAFAALHVFDQYLERGGALAEEASFGRVRALRALGQRYAEAKALSAFLQAYPNSPLSPALEARRRELGVR